jgi:hypothetical protein
MKLFQLIALLAFLILGTTMSYAADVKNEVDGSASLDVFSKEREVQRVLQKRRKDAKDLECG